MSKLETISLLIEIFQRLIKLTGNRRKSMFLVRRH